MDAALHENDGGDTRRLAVFYTHGQSSTGAGSGDLPVIIDALRAADFEVEVLDLADLARNDDGTFFVRVPRTGLTTTWRVPHAALMYHGAIGPPDAVELLAAIEAAGCVVINGSDAWPVFTDKHLFADYMAERQIRVIPTKRVTTLAELHDAVDAVGGNAIVKKSVSTEGDDIFVARTDADVERIGIWMERLGGELIVQPIIDGHIRADLESGIRALVHDIELDRRHEFRVHTSRSFDGTVSVDATYMRIAPDAVQVVNNCAQGARAIAVEFDDLHADDQHTVLEAARQSPPRGDLIGWDLIGQPGRRHVIEGNSGSGLPDGNEGIDPSVVVDPYVQVMRDAADASVLVGAASVAQPV